MKIKIFCILGLSLLFFSCQSIKVPVPEGDQDCQLVIRVKTENTARKQYFISYRVYLDSGESFMIYPQEGYLHVKSLKPGDYRITGRQAYYRKTGKYGSRENLNIPFTLKPGTITVLDTLFNIYLINNLQEPGRYYQQLKTGDMGTVHREQALAYLAEYENIYLWKVEFSR